MDCCYKYSFNNFMELNDKLASAMKDEALNKILSETLGAFSIKYRFVNYLTEKHFIEANGGKHFTHKITRDFVFKFIYNYMFKDKNISQADLLIISRNRNLNSQGKRYLVDDYLFYNIIEILLEKNRGLKLSLYVIDRECKQNLNIDIISAFDLVSFYDIIKACYSSMRINILWIVNKNKIMRYLKDTDNTYILQSIDRFFNFLDLFIYTAAGLSLQKIIDLKRPRIILANDDCISIKPICKYKDYKFIVLQSANISEPKESLKRAILEHDNSLKPDYFLCSGIKFKEQINRYNISNNVIIVGQPQYDRFAFLTKDISAKYLKMHNELNNVILLMLTLHSSTDQENVNYLLAIFESIIHIKNIDILIKLHPFDNNAHIQLVKKCLNTFKIYAAIYQQDGDLAEMIYISDLIISNGSSAVRECVLLNKPVIIFDSLPAVSKSEFVINGVAAGVSDKIGLKDSIESLLINDFELAKNRAKYIENYLYKNDGRASQRILDIINSLF